MLLPSACVYPEMKHVGSLGALSPNFPGALYLDICTPETSYLRAIYTRDNKSQLAQDTNTP